MSMFGGGNGGGGGQYEDSDPTKDQDNLDDRLQEELQLRAAGIPPHAAATRLAASRALAFSQAGNQEAAYLAMLSAGGDAAAAASPYYQRQAAAAAAAAAAYRPYLAQQATGAYTSNTDALYGGRSPYATYPSQSSPTDQQRYAAAAAAAYGQRSFDPYYRGQSQSSSSNVLDRGYGSSQPPEPETTPDQPQASPIVMQSFLNKGQSTPKSPLVPSPSSVGTSPRPGRGNGRGGTGRGGNKGRGRGGRGRGTPGPKTTPILPSKPQKAGEVEGEGGQRYYNGCVPLGLPEDKYWLSELQVYLRSNFAEAFGATEADIAAPMHGRNKPIALGQVGIRCMHCRNDRPSERGQQATSYPSLISGIYNSVQQMLRLHFDCCLSMPADVRAKIEQLKVSSSARGGRKQYWIDSAKRLGLIDTPHGIHFGRDPYGPLPPLSGPSAEDEAKLKMKMNAEKEKEKEKSFSIFEEEKPVIPEVEPYPLVLPEDKDLISDYLYLTLEQMQPCNLMEADRVGCYKGREVGFPGLACKHCVGQAGCGRYFPASEASLSQTTTSQTIMNHVRNCRRCPIEIRENLELMKRARMGPDGKRGEKPKHGGRKVFFHRLWCRIQRIPLSEDEPTGKRKGGPWSRRGKAKKNSPKKRSTSASASDDEEEEEEEAQNQDESGSEEETETEDEESSDEETGSGKGKSKGGKGRKLQTTWHEGCVRLTKSDDPHWLSEMQCFVRSEMVEVFSHNDKDDLGGYSGRKLPAVGQVGVRCVFCKNMDEEERPNGCVYFPDSLAAIHTKVGDLIRLHFPSCQSIPDDTKSTFKSQRGFGLKADGDAQQYWVDAARDIGLADVPPGGYDEGWGISFRRDPLEPSPADDLDRENAGAEIYEYDNSSLVRGEDKDICTDHTMLLLRQVKPCQFKKTDRRGGPGARGRDRSIGFPGLACKHCTSKTSFGRYFPVSAKNLTDNTANSLASHVASCSKCPEPIKASLAYLTHRNTLQKAELSGSWKKTFYKRVWERLHVERAWADEEEEGKPVPTEESEGSSEEEGAAGGSKEKEGEGESEEEEEMGGNMSNLIKAAAVWLSEQDATQDSSKSRNSRGRGLPGRNRGGNLPVASPNSTGSGGGGGSSAGSAGRSNGGTSKRRRVHF